MKKRTVIFRYTGMLSAAIAFFCMFCTSNASALSVSTFAELSDAVTAGEAEITIENDFEFTSLLTLTQDLKINGQGKTASRGDGYLGGFFSIPADVTLEIDNLVIDGGAPGWSMDYENRVYTNPTDNSGYIRVPTINGVDDIIANASLFVNSGSLTLDNSTVQNARLGQYAANNKTVVRGAVISGKGNNTIKNSVIKHNGAYDNGGALYITGGSTSIENSTVSENASGLGHMLSRSGGVMYMTDANLTITDTEFKDNFAQGNGAIGLIYKSNIHIKDSMFDHNMVGNDGSAFQFQSTVSGKSLSIEDCIFQNNIGFATTNQSMGVIWQTAWQSTADEPVIYRNLIFRGNVARTGGAISDGSSENTYILLENVEVYENESAGGILYGQSGNYTLRNVYVHDNSGGNGTGVYSRGSNIVVEDSRIENNNATGSGGGVYVSAGNITIRNSTITGNTSDARGGGIFVRGRYEGDDPSLTIEGTTIKDNSAETTGGGIAVADNENVYSSITVDDQSAIYDNKAAVAADDFSYVRDNNSENTSGNTITLDNISIAGVNGIDGWYHDGEDDRFKDTDNPTVFTAYIDNNGNIAFYLKAAGISTGDYDGNGGSTDAKPVTVKYGEVYVVDDSIPVRDGYTFIEWNTKPDGSGMSLKAGDTYDGSDGWTLYAQWKKNEPKPEPEPEPNPSDTPSDNTKPDELPKPVPEPEKSENPNTGDRIMLAVAIVPVLAIGGLTAVKYAAKRRNC